jgi:hypothetical protein
VLTPSTIESKDLICLVFHKLFCLPSALVIFFFYQDYMKSPQGNPYMHVCCRGAFIVTHHNCLLLSNP